VDAAVIVALIALVGTLANAGITYALTTHSERRRMLEKEDALWRRQRASLAFAAGELSDRIGNILEGWFLEAYGRDGAYTDEAVTSTLFRFAQYFGWSEVLRRAMRVSAARHATEARILEEQRAAVARTFSTDRYGPGPFMIWRESQRAIGELMIVKDGDVVDTVGVAAFVADFENFRPWLQRIELVMRNQPSSQWPRTEVERLKDVQSLLDVLRDDVSPSRPGTSSAARS
jgi:hypothetical protein